MKVTSPLVSVIVTTANSAAVLKACLQSIQEQDYDQFELLVVDNHSTDNTLEIARQYTDRVYSFGPERSSQRNFGVQQAHGKYVLIIDSDMELSPAVISACVTAIEQNQQAKGVIIPEESFGQGFWTACKKLEKSYYIGVDWIEAARFYDRTTFLQLGGFNESLISGEDWDLSQRVGAQGSLMRIDDLIYHNEGRLNLWRTVKKKFYYARHISRYMQHNKQHQQFAHQMSPWKRYALYFSQPAKILAQPLTWLGMMIMKTLELSGGVLGVLFSETPHRVTIQPTAAEFLRTQSLDNTLLIGFYGGGNFGDELLLEVLQRILHQRGVTNLALYYQQPKIFSQYHQNLGYRLIDARKKQNLLVALWQTRRILIGGGGLWGLDANLNILWLGVLLWVSSLLGKEIYLLGVGYYDSTNLYGRISAWLTGKAAKAIFARDQETWQNFRAIQSRTFLDKDLAFCIPEFTLLDNTQPAELPFSDQPQIVVTLRRFNDDRGDKYHEFVTQLVTRNPDKNFLLLLCEPRTVDPAGYKHISELGKLPHVSYQDFAQNPLSWVKSFSQPHQRLAVIAPQYHMIISALLTHTQFFPVVYDNKVRQLLRREQHQTAPDISQVTYQQLQTFVDHFYES